MKKLSVSLVRNHCLIIVLQDQLRPLDPIKHLIKFDKAGVTDTVDYIARFIISSAGCIFLIAPMVALSFIYENRYRLLLVSLLYKISVRTAIIQLLDLVIDTFVSFKFILAS